MKLSISQLSELTGEDRRTVTAKIEGLPHENGAKGAMLYYSAGIGDPIALRTREISHLCARSMSIENFSADFSLSHAIWCVSKSDQNLVRIPVAGGRAEYPASRFLAILPHRHCRVVVLGANES